MVKDIDDLMKFIDQKNDKPEGELVSLCKFRADKSYLQKKKARIKNLEDIREELKVAEFHLFNFLSAMNDETHTVKSDVIVIDHIRFMFDQWYSVKDIVERKIKEAKQEL